MKDAHDSKTLDLIPAPAKRGRPRTGRAMTAAEKQAAYRARRAANVVTVTFNRDDVPALKLLLANPNPALDVDQGTLDRIAQAVFAAAL